jgi:hypothetical protein
LAIVAAAAEQIASPLVISVDFEIVAGGFGLAGDMLAVGVVVAVVVEPELPQPPIASAATSVRQETFAGMRIGP